jgi:hypothetical protein
MAARLGNVLYWLGCFAAVPPVFWAIGNAYVLYSGSTAPIENEWHIMVSIAAAIAFWVVGRTCRFVLAET